MESLESSHRYLWLREGIHSPVRQPNQTAKDHKRAVASWFQGLNPEGQLLSQILSRQVFGLLGVSSTAEIQPLIDNPDLRKATSDRVIGQLGLVYGIRGSERIRQKFEDYGTYADSVIYFLQHYLSYEGSVNLEMVNEVHAYNDPTDLLLLALDGKWSAKARFEAKRKLLLMNLGAAIDRREREVGIEDQFKKFVNWLHERVWNPDLLLGESQGVFLISKHAPETWACLEYQMTDEETGVGLTLQPHQKKTHLPRRSFKTGTGKEKDTYVTIRDKTMVAKILKMLRKGAEDPAIAVDDDTGLLVVVNNNRDAREIINLLIERGYQSNYPIIIEDVSYTLDGGEYDNKNGGSRKIKMLKFFIRLANEMRVECIVHTPKTYAEYLYMRGVSHEEYGLRRLFNSEGVDVPRLLFPQKYFPHFDMDEAKRQKLQQIRANIEANAT